MEEFFTAIEERIKASGYPNEVNGSELYDEISDEIEQKENGSYIFMLKKEHDTVYEVKVDIYDDSFNLSYVRITDPTGTYQADFDD